MSEITLKGNKINTIGSLPKKGEKALDFALKTVDLGVKTLNDYKGKSIVLNIFPSVDTGTCASSVRKFNEEAAKLDRTVVLCVSKDLPFAQKRFCAAEGIENVEMLSDYTDGSFGEKYGVTIVDGPLSGLLSRAIVIINENQEIIYTEQISEITEEPNYNEALKAIS